MSLEALAPPDTAAPTLETVRLRTVPDLAAAAQEPPMLSTLHVVMSPLLFRRYRKIRELGRGGMGVVWLAQDEVLGIPVALKLVPEELARSADDLEALRKEVLRGIALTHSGIVRVYSFEREPNLAAIIMEYVEGESLAQMKARQPGRCFEPEQVRPWLEQLCSVLDYAHGEAKIAHRDLKPGNLMITPEGRLKVADFGIASSLSETLDGVSIRIDASGTPPYMSPQQAMGNRPTSADDIYAVGATLYDLLTGKPPFYRGSVVTQLLHETPAAMSERRVELGLQARPLPPNWERAVAACLEKDPVKRPPSGASLLQLLDTPTHALVPYHSRPPVPLETLRLDTQPVSVRPVSAPTIAQREVPRERVIEATYQIIPQRDWWGGFCRVFGFLNDSVLVPVRDELLAWFRRLVWAAVIVAGIFGLLYLAQSLPSRPVPAPLPTPVVEAAPPAPAAPPSTEAPAPPQMQPPPPPMGFPPPPPPPFGGGGPPGGGQRPPPPRH